ncbi:MAG: GNAT family N-acetyltransferase [Bacteroidota bacterium]
METKSYTKAQLEEFICSEQFNNLINIPISKHRAISQINNPRASDEDILLVVSFDENKVIGYLGILPDYIFFNDKTEKVGWLTCFWVDDEYKSQNIAASLFLRVIRAWKQQILITNIVPWLEPIYQKTKIFKPTVYKEGFRGYLRSNLAEILPPKKKIFARISPFLKFIDLSVNLAFDLWIKLYRTYDLDNYRAENIENIDKQDSDFIDLHKVNYWSQRSKTELDWITKYPWLIKGTEKDSANSRYYFSAFSENFYNQKIKITDIDNNIIGIIFLTIKDNNLNVPFVFVDKKNIDVISMFLTNKMLELKLNMITVFNYELSVSLNKIKTPFYFKKTIKKPYFITKKFDFLEDLYFQDGDGDCVFY